jgi:hypothetical protein
MTNLNTIYDEFTIGSNGMIRAIQTHCGGAFDISDAECARILAVAETASEFEHLWENADWWRDDVVIMAHGPTGNK